MPYNHIVRDERYRPESGDDEVAQFSALRAVQLVLRPVSGLSLRHQRELLSLSLWKWTGAAGIAPHPKFNVRYATRGALDHGHPTKINHEHVWP